MEPRILGIHHVTAIAGDPQRNLDFYTEALGLRLVKQTVNFDDPGTYHLYYGDDLGHPGTILTFFPWPGAARGRAGAGQTSALAFGVPADSLGYWRERLRRRGLAPETSQRLGEEVLAFSDPDGLPLELVAHPAGAETTPWHEGPVPPEHAVHGIHSVTLSEASSERTASLLTETLGFRRLGEEGGRFRFEAGAGGSGTRVDLVRATDGQRGLMGAGAVHHVAWRTPDDAQQRAWHAQIGGLGYSVSPVMDRQYFHSIYFREPGGVLFEIATDPPGFAIDESVEALGTHLMLPPQYAPYRAEIERALPALHLPMTRPEGQR